MNKKQIQSKIQLLSLSASKQVLVDIIVYLSKKMDDIPETVEEYSRVAEEVYLALMQRYTKELEGKPKEQRVIQVDLETSINEIHEEREKASKGL